MIPALLPPGLDYLLEFVASQHGLTASQLRSGRCSAKQSAVKAEAAWTLRVMRHSWPVIARAMGYRQHCSAIQAAARWERMRKGGR